MTIEVCCFLDTKPGGFNLSNYGDELGVSNLLKDLIILIITQVFFDSIFKPIIVWLFQQMIGHKLFCGY
jgi:hypothetical protein